MSSKTLVSLEILLNSTSLTEYETLHCCWLLFQSYISKNENDFVAGFLVQGL